MSSEQQTGLNLQVQRAGEIKTVGGKRKREIVRLREDDTKAGDVLTAREKLDSGGINLGGGARARGCCELAARAMACGKEQGRRCGLLFKEAGRVRIRRKGPDSRDCGTLAASVRRRGRARVRLEDDGGGDPLQAGPGCQPLKEKAALAAGLLAELGRPRSEDGLSGQEGASRPQRLGLFHFHIFFFKFSEIYVSLINFRFGCQSPMARATGGLSPLGWATGPAPGFFFSVLFCLDRQKL